MKLRQCKVCTSSFQARTNYKCCSHECSRTNQKRRMKAWNVSHPERILAFKREFNDRMSARERAA